MPHAHETVAPSSRPALRSHTETRTTRARTRTHAKAPWNAARAQKNPNSEWGLRAESSFRTEARRARRRRSLILREADVLISNQHTSLS